MVHQALASKPPKYCSQGTCHFETLIKMWFNKITVKYFRIAIWKFLTVNKRVTDLASADKVLGRNLEEEIA